VDAVWGDVDNDNALTWEDAARCARLTAGLETADSPARSRADVDADGAVGLADVVTLARALSA
jgi:hypothetical protein